MATQPPATVSETPTNVTRQNFATMSDEDRNRWFNNIMKMAENESGAGSNSLYDNMMIHGEPRKNDAPSGGFYCAHYETRFLPWHRLYMVLYEEAYQKADIDNGGDGNVGVPYWDWAKRDHSGYDKETYPFDFLTPDQKTKLTKYAPDFYPPPTEPGLVYPNPIERRSTDAIYADFAMYNVGPNAEESLGLGDFIDFGTAAHSGLSLENPHGMIHVSIGRTMSLVPFSSYDFLFWLHHCNIDRYFERYLRTNGVEKCVNDYRTGDPRNFNVPLIPFGTAMPKEGMHLSDVYRFQFDVLPLAPPAPMRILHTSPNLRMTLSADIDQGVVNPELDEFHPQSRVVFKSILVPELRTPSSKLIVFVMPSDQADAFVAPTTAIESMQSQYFAGACSIFRGGENCLGCAMKGPFDVSLNVTNALTTQNLTKSNAAVRVVVQEIPVYGALPPRFILTPGDGSGIPMAVLESPLFADRGDISAGSTPQGDVLNLQEYLSRFGYYDAKIDGVYGDLTAMGVQAVQRSAGLESSGIVDDATKKQMMHTPRCGERESEAVPDPFYEGRKALTYSVSNIPHYLDAEATLAVFESVFAQYSAAVGGLSFTRVDLSDDGDEKEDVNGDIKIAFLRNKDMDAWNIQSARFHGAGGVLAHGGDGYCHFDVHEHWTLDAAEIGDLNDSQFWRSGKPITLLEPVALHEIGHSLGLSHSDGVGNVMNAFYNPRNLMLSDDDTGRLNAIYMST